MSPDWNGQIYKRMEDKPNECLRAEIVKLKEMQLKTSCPVETWRYNAMIKDRQAIIASRKGGDVDNPFYIPTDEEKDAAGKAFDEVMESITGRKAPKRKQYSYKGVF